VEFDRCNHQPTNVPFSFLVLIHNLWSEFLKNVIHFDRLSSIRITRILFDT